MDSKASLKRDKNLNCNMNKHTRVAFWRVVGLALATALGYVMIRSYQGGFIAMTAYLIGLGFADSNPRTQ